MTKVVQGVALVPGSGGDVCKCGKCGSDLRVCRECRRVFPIRRADAVYCSESCKKKHGRRR